MTLVPRAGLPVLVLIVLFSQYLRKLYIRFLGATSEPAAFPDTSLKAIYAEQMLYWSPKLIC